MDLAVGAKTPPARKESVAEMVSMPMRTLGCIFHGD